MIGKLKKNKIILNLYRLMRDIFYFLRLFLLRPQFRNLIYHLYSIQKTNIFCFFSNFEIGGAERIHYNLVNSLAPQKVILFFTRKKYTPKGKCFEKYLNNHISIIRLDTILDNHILYKEKDFLFRFLAFWIGKNKKNKIFSSICAAFHDFIAYIDDDVYNCNLVHDTHSESLVRYSLRNTDKLSKRFISHFNLKQIYQQLYLKQGIDEKYIERIKTLPYRIEGKIIQKTKLPSLPIKVVFVGRNHERDKRISWVIDLAEKTYVEKLPIIFSFLGTNMNLLPISPAYSIHENKYGQELNDFYLNDIDITLLLSPTEGLPLVFMEGSTFGCVPLSTEVGGIGEYYTHKKNAFLIPDNLSKEKTIAVALEYLKEIVDNPTILIEMREENYRLAKEKFIDITIMTDNFKKEFLSQNEANNI
ncbi:MAG: glycosyltransferase [Cytophagia bacterium]|nr:MAG: glycosyltransferase [Cytophagia bacterium]